MDESEDELELDEREFLEKYGGMLEALHARHRDCPSFKVLLASPAGVLPQETSQKVASHVGRCSFCRILLKEMAAGELPAATAEEKQRIRARVLSARDSQTKAAKGGGGFFREWFWKAGPIGAFAAATVLLALWVGIHQPVAPISGRAATAGPQATKPEVSSVFEWEKLPIKLQASSILIVRGEPRTAQEKYTSQLTDALAQYHDGNYAEAEKALAQVAKNFPRGVEAQLYLGVSQLKLEKNAEAVPRLRAAQELGPETFRDDVTWYLALAYQRTGDTQRAVTELQKLCKGKSGYARRACTGAHELSGPAEEKH
jgi:tetratricopeptide (TPR) repeat protein